jgi:hypothetical protein
MGEGRFDTAARLSAECTLSLRAAATQGSAGLATAALVAGIDAPQTGEQ